MNFSYWFSNRIRLRHDAPASTSTGVVIAIVGVALALMVMELSLAVASGFKHEIERKVMGFDANISVLPAYDYYTATSANDMQLTDSLRKVITTALPQTTPVQTFSRHAILKTANDFMAVECISKGDGHDSSFEKSIMVEGEWPEFSKPHSQDSIVISTPIARKLGLNTGDKVYLYFFVDEQPKARRAFIAGMYQSNFGEYDDAIIYTSLPLMQQLGALDSLSCTSVAIEGLAKDEIEQATEQLQNVLLEAYSRGDLTTVHPVNNVFNTGALFFNWLDLLDTNVIVIFILMICVATFTLISSLFIIILDRVPTIGILRALGAARTQVSRIFVFTALRLVGIGMIIGNLLAIGLMLLQDATHFLPLDPQMYYLAYVPFEINWTSILALNIGIIGGAWLILILPARLAARIDPAATMRYE